VNEGSSWDGNENTVEIRESQDSSFDTEKQTVSRVNQRLDFSKVNLGRVHEQQEFIVNNLRQDFENGRGAD